ncbi:MAG: ATP-binding protein [Bacteroides sp.]|nr:ATP-binding protein [Ruminococcus flavefaciens]MCM1554748.1 ATP-binding protein [Bacteroides sp.]
MIAEFNVENFLSIKSAQKISFEPTPDTTLSEQYTHEVKPGVRLLKIGIIYGANASGKTNILTAFEFFKMLVLVMPQDRNANTVFMPFLLDDTSKNGTTKTVMSFYIGPSKYILSFELDAKHILSETLIVYDSNRPTKLYSRSYHEATDSTSIEFGTNLKLSKKSQDIISGNTLNNGSVLAAFGKSNVEKTKLNDVYDYFDRQVGDVLTPGMLLSGYIKRRLYSDGGGELKRFILNFLKASDFNIEDVVLQEKEELITTELEQAIRQVPVNENTRKELLKKGTITSTELIFTHHAGEHHYTLGEGNESNGTMRFLGIATILYFLLKKNQFVAIDEVESSIHYELLAYFIKVFLANSEQTSQMLLTTHDINLLNEDFIRRDTIWFADKNELGETKIIRLSSLGLHKNLSPYHAYRQNKLVKLPFLGSIYFDLNDENDEAGGK